MVTHWPPIPVLRVSRTWWVTRSPHPPSMKGSLHLTSMRGEPGVGGRAGLALPQPHTGAHREQRGAEPRTPSCGNKACKPALPLPLHVSAGLGKQSIHPRGAPCSRTVSARPRRGLNVHSPTPGRNRQKFRTEKYI